MRRRTPRTDRRSDPRASRPCAAADPRPTRPRSIDGSAWCSFRWTTVCGRPARMKRLTDTVEVEVGQRGSNHGLVTTSDGLVLIDGPHKPSDTLRLKAEIERRGKPLRYILNTEPHGDHWTSNAYFDVPVVAHAGVRE